MSRGSQLVALSLLVAGLVSPALAHGQDPRLTLASILTDPPIRSGPVDAGYDGLAVLCKMVYDAGGLPALRELARAGREPGAVVSTAARLLKVPESQLDAAWRRRIAELARQ